jgi:hypothetical protein
MAKTRREFIGEGAAVKGTALGEEHKLIPALPVARRGQALVVRFA